jgi:hypothetical protein
MSEGRERGHAYRARARARPGQPCDSSSLKAHKAERSRLPAAPDSAKVVAMNAKREIRVA